MWTLSAAPSQLLGPLASSSHHEHQVTPRLDNMPQWWGTGAFPRITDNPILEHNMSKRARKRRSRKGNAANHGRKPNA